MTVTALDQALPTAEREGRTIRRLLALLHVEIDQLPNDSSLRDSLVRCVDDLEEAVS